MPSPKRSEIERILEELEQLIPKFSTLKPFEVIDRTEATLKVRVPIERELYIQLYANIEKGKLNLTLVHRNQRIYGEDAEGGIVHIHPFVNPDEHLEVESSGSLEGFFAKVQEYLEESGLI